MESMYIRCRARIDTVGAVLQWGEIFHANVAVKALTTSLTARNASRRHRQPIRARGIGAAVGLNRNIGRSVENMNWYEDIDDPYSGNIAL